MSKEPQSIHTQGPWKDRAQNRVLSKGTRVILGQVRAHGSTCTGCLLTETHKRAPARLAAAPRWRELTCIPGLFCFLTLHPPDALCLRLTEPLLAGLQPGALKTRKPEAEALLNTWRAVLVLLSLPGLSLGVEGPSLRSHSHRQ